MAVYVGSRYETGDIQNVKVGPDQYNVSLFPQPPNTVGLPYTVMLVPNGTRLDVLAFQILGDTNQWWVIADLNPEIDDFFDIPMGTMLRVPMVAGTTV